MKVTQNENSFQPITIVLETENEARVVTALLGALTTGTEEAFARALRLTVAEVQEVTDSLFDPLCDRVNNARTPLALRVE